MPEPDGPKRKAVFVDRDGTINVDLTYISDPNLIEVYRGVTEGLRMLSNAGYLLIVVTNQSGISRGLYTHGTVAAIHQRLREILARGGVSIDGFFYCPHTPEDACDCRKPRTGLLVRAEKLFNIDMARSAIIGNSEGDVEAGRKLGLFTVLVHQPHFTTAPSGTKTASNADAQAPGFVEASRAVLSRP